MPEAACPQNQIEVIGHSMAGHLEDSFAEGVGQ